MIGGAGSRSWITKGNCDDLDVHRTMIGRSRAYAVRRRARAGGEGEGGVKSELEGEVNGERGMTLLSSHTALHSRIKGSPTKNY